MFLIGMYRMCCGWLSVFLNCLFVLFGVCGVVFLLVLVMWWVCRLR